LRVWLWRVGALVLLAAIAAALTSLAGSSASSEKRAVGALTSKGCVDDNDTATDPTQGEDSCKQSTDGLAAVSAITVSPDGKSVYAVSEGENTLVAFKRARNGSLKPQGCVVDDDNTTPDACAATSQGLAGAGSVVASPDGKSVYVASESDSTVAIFKRNRRTGKLTPKGCVIATGIAGDTCARHADALNGTSWLAISRDGKSVYATGADAVVRFARNLKTGALKSKGCIEDSDVGPGLCTQATPGLEEAGAIALSPDGRSAYVTTEIGTLETLARSRKSGVLTPRGCIIDHNVVGGPACAKKASGLDHAEAIIVSPDGKSVYEASGIDSALARFDRNTKTGALKPRGCTDDPDTGLDNCANSAHAMNEGAAVVVSSDGKSVYYGAGSDDAVVRFKRAKTGALKPAGCIDDNDTGADTCPKSANGLGKVSALAISPNGKSLYATSETDDAVTRFARSR
jgi:DNA-binding beta-propeller fold protein YncE